MRISELEAQATTLAAARDRLARSKDALVTDAFRSQDLLKSASDRLMRLRQQAPTPGRGLDGSGDGHRPGRSAVSVARSGRSNNDCATSGAELFRNPLVAGASTDGDAGNGAGRLDAGRGGVTATAAADQRFPNGNNHGGRSDGASERISASGRGISSSFYPPLSVYSSTEFYGNATSTGATAAGDKADSVNLRESMPGWVETTWHPGSPGRRAFLRDSAGEERGEGVGGSVGAAMEVLREVERMQVRCWVV